MEFLFNKVAALRACNFVKKKLRNMCSPVNIAKFLRTPFFTEHLPWLFLWCTGYCFVQYWPKQTKTNLCRLFSFKIIAAYSGPILHKNFLVQCCFRCISATLSVRFSYAEAVVLRCSVKNLFLKISQNSQKNTCARVSF